MILTTVQVPDSVPERLKRPLGLLTGEVQDLHIARCLLWDLCIDAPENVKLINGTAPYFFKRLQSILIEHLILGIARLTDPSLTAGNKNLGFADLFAGSAPTQLADLQSQAADIRKIRSKIVAHLDWKAGLDPSTLPGDKIFRKIRACTDIMVEIINLAWMQWVGGELTMPDSDAVEITNCLEKSVAYDVLEREGLVIQDFWNAPHDMRQEFLRKARRRGGGA